jgi:hypothetical protein
LELGVAWVLHVHHRWCRIDPTSHKSCIIPSHLELDVAWILHVALDVHGAVAKGRLSLLLRLLQQRQEVLLLGGQAHATTTTTCGLSKQQQQQQLALSAMTVKTQCCTQERHCWCP